MFYLVPDLKSVKDMFKKFYLLLVVGAALACHAAPSKPIKVAGSNDLQPDGIAGPETWACINAKLSAANQVAPSGDSLS